MYTRWILRACDRFKKLPSEVLAEDAELLLLLNIENLDDPEGGGGG